MRNISLTPIRSLGVKFDVSGLAAELAAHPELWNQYTARTENHRSPHRETSDIWVRYRSMDDFDGDIQKFNGPHEAVWYSVAHQLPSAKRIAENLLNRFNGLKLGGVLITKIPAHKQVYPHIDGGWHAGFYEKIAVQIAGNETQEFCVGETVLSPLTGDTFWFRNDIPHYVTNNSDEDRITLICCVQLNNAP